MRLEAHKEGVVCGRVKRGAGKVKMRGVLKEIKAGEEAARVKSGVAEEREV